MRYAGSFACQPTEKTTLVVVSRIPVTGGRAAATPPRTPLVKSKTPVGRWYFYYLPAVPFPLTWT